MWNLTPIGRKRTAVFLILTCWLSATAAKAVASKPDDIAFHENLILVDINRQQFNETVLVLQDETGEFYLSSQDMQRWRLTLPERRLAHSHQGDSYYPLWAITGVTPLFDPKKLTLMIEARPEAFSETTRTAGYASIPAPQRSGTGGFFNYDVIASHATGSPPQRAGQFELGFFNRRGVGTSNLLAENHGNHTRLTRLDSTWTIDSAETMQSWQIGDAINRPGSWGRSVRFGGIQYATKFATQPGYVTFPAQSVAGQAVLPSAVDVFVNNALVSRQNVPPGPFSVGNLPVVSGAGEVRLVVRDLLGREQLITQPFYGSPALMRAGLEDFSYEIGRVRENFGIASNDYGSWLGSGTYRRGVSERFTGEVHGETMQAHAALGVGGDYLMAGVGTLSAHLAGSHLQRQGKTGNGGLLLVGFDHQARPWSVGARSQWMSSGFSQIGMLPQQPPPIQASSFSFSYASGNGSSTGFAYVMQHNRDQADVRITTLSYSTAFGRWASFSISAVRNWVGAGDTTVFAMLSAPLDQSTSLSFGSQFVRGRNTGDTRDFSATLQRSLPLGEGYGYRVMANANRSTEASLLLQNNIGTYTLGAAESAHVTSTRVGASGGVAVLGGDAFLGRRIDQSFAVARIPDYPNVRILADNLPAGQTDAHGNALIPRLRAYDRNVISIDQRDLPLDAQIGALKLDVVPYFRSGVDVLFPIRHSHGATLTVQLESGQPLPVGATVQLVRMERLADKDEIHVVGYEGEVYVTGLAPTNRLLARWHGQQCEFGVPFPASRDPLPHLGTFICKGISP